MTACLYDFLYCVELVGGEIAKVGVSKDPKTRMSSLKSTAPFDLRLRHVIGFQSRKVADAWERYILSNANRYKDRGEWVRCDDTLDSLFASVSEGFDITSSIDDGPIFGRPIPEGVAVCDVHAVIVKERLSGADLAGIEFSGEEDDFEKSIIRGRLRQGFGVEDIAVMDKIEVGAVREYVSELRKSGLLLSVLHNQTEGLSQ